MTRTIDGTIGPDSIGSRRRAASTAEQSLRLAPETVSPLRARVSANMIDAVAFKVKRERCSANWRANGRQRGDGSCGRLEMRGRVVAFHC